MIKRTFFTKNLFFFCVGYRPITWLSKLYQYNLYLSKSMVSDPFRKLTNSWLNRQNICRFTNAPLVRVKTLWLFVLTNQKKQIKQKKPKTPFYINLAAHMNNRLFIVIESVNQMDLLGRNSDSIESFTK